MGVVGWCGTSYSPFTVGTVPVAFYAVPYCSSYCLGEVSVCHSIRYDVTRLDIPPYRMRLRSLTMLPMDMDLASGLGHGCRPSRKLEARGRGEGGRRDFDCMIGCRDGLVVT